MPLEQAAPRTNASSRLPQGILARVEQETMTATTGDRSDGVDGDWHRRNERLTQWFQIWRTAMCRWLSSRWSIQAADLDDVAQEVFMRLLRYSDAALVEHPQSYLFRIATNVVNDWHERARNKLPHDEAGIEALEIEPHHEPENTAEQTLLSQQVQIAVRQLQPRQRQVLLLHINEELTYQQIAVELNLSPRIVRRDVARAYSELRCELSDLKPQ